MKGGKNGIVIPIIVLVIVTFVMTLILVLINGQTETKIAELKAQTELEARIAVLPEADNLTEKTVKYNDNDVTYWEADNGAGYVFQVASKGYGGDVVLMVGVSADGTVTGTEVTEMSETAGLGAKCTDANWRAQLNAAVPADPYVVVKNKSVSEKAENEIVAITAATITSRSITKSMNQVRDLYNIIKGGAE